MTSISLSLAFNSDDCLSSWEANAAMRLSIDFSKYQISRSYPMEMLCLLISRHSIGSPRSAYKRIQIQLSCIWNFVHQIPHHHYAPLLRTQHWLLRRLWEVIFSYQFTEWQKTDAANHIFEAWIATWYLTSAIIVHSLEHLSAQYPLPS